MCLSLVAFDCGCCGATTLQVSDEGYCLPCADYFEYHDRIQDMEDRAEYESEYEVMPVTAKAFTHAGLSYFSHSEIVDTAYGPENYVSIWNAEGDCIYRQCDAASTATIIEWWKNDMDCPF